MLKQESVECLKQANRVVNKAKKKSQIDIPDLENLEQLKIVAYSDASFGNLTDGGSQRGYILFWLETMTSKCSLPGNPRILEKSSKVL